MRYELGSRIRKRSLSVAEPFHHGLLAAHRLWHGTMGYPFLTFDTTEHIASTGERNSILRAIMSWLDRVDEGLLLLRKRAGKPSQSEVAQDARITNRMLSSYETGRTRPSPETLVRILDVYDVSLDEFRVILEELRALHQRIDMVTNHGDSLPEGSGGEPVESAAAGDTLKGSIDALTQALREFQS